jgi:hypothetical protein
VRLRKTDGRLIEGGITSLRAADFLPYVACISVLLVRWGRPKALPLQSFGRGFVARRDVQQCVL